MTDNNPLTTTLVEDEPREEDLPPARAWLTSIGSPEDNFVSAGEIRSLEAPHTIHFGRDEEASGASFSEGENSTTIGIPFGWVSGHHASVEVTGGPAGLAFTLEDLGSRNGTLVNGHRVSGRVAIRSQDVIEVGRSFWMVRQVRLRRSRVQGLGELDRTGTCNPHLQQIERTLLRLAGSAIPIVLRGETGTGKQYMARAVHRSSGRDGPFVLANLAALSPDRVEAVLFGDDGSAGLFEKADRGTLMLDEMGELSGLVQGKLLSALSEGRAARVGEQDQRRFDVRLICGTMHDLARMVEGGRFRADLYSRLAGYVAELPPVRARREDLGLLVRRVIGDLHADGRRVRVTTNAFRRILVRAWPFNVRQLRQTLTTASLLTSGDGTITSDALAEVLDEDDGLPENPDEVRRVRAELLRHLAEHQGDPVATAQAMGMEIGQIGRWIERFDLTVGAASND
ncbi:MAG: sigma 54-interacting transcriptional regulator [Myxococcota bacterium]